MHPLDRLQNAGEAAAADAPDAADFRTVYRLQAAMLLRFFRRRLSSQDEAEDLTQETLARFLRAAPSTDIAAPEGYLRTIAANLLRDRAERNSTKIAALSSPLDDGLDFPSQLDPHRELSARQELDHYRRILEKLKPTTLQIFLLHRVEGYTHKEIAERLGLNLWSVKRQMVKAIAHLDEHRRRR
jgi:RNA polymerase sigma-70 factor (ECF subfamily)